MSNIDREDKTQASFQLSRDKWQRFQSKCRDNGSSASEILNLLVNIYLQEEIINYQTLLLLCSDTKISQIICDYIQSQFDNYIDRYIEQKLVKGIQEIDSNLGEIITKNHRSVQTEKHEKKEQTEKSDEDEKQSSITQVIEEENLINNNFTDNDQELKTARELAKILHCSPAYITTLNRLGDLKYRGWRDSGKRDGKAILYQRVNF
ncbi:MAG: hypothetical protein QNJ68_19410 [Microcoleaceae cyanobacterium MO_207.B10]|nr:hypothetical protein [Microcoleaceae cyanobacterium MO_207.B10]